MQVRELIELLQQANPDDEVRVATQPSWPLAFDVSGVALPTQELECNTCGSWVSMNEEGELYHPYERDNDHEASLPEWQEDVLPEGVVWIAAAEHPASPASPYAPAGAFNPERSIW